MTDNSNPQIPSIEIPESHYLSSPAICYYHAPYNTVKSGDCHHQYILNLKNDKCDKSPAMLQNAMRTLAAILLEEIPQIVARTGATTLVTIPRSKAENTYSSNRLLFKKTVSKVVQILNKRGHQPPLEDGTSYLIRHTNTKATHYLYGQHPELAGDGPLPHPGITAETCHIDPNVAGKNILLIDDIYTPGVGIDDDAIQALRDAGAHAVTLYALGKARGFSFRNPADEVIY
ncbi:MAG: phosphoribosyltransferase [Kiritimatiellia bacterium]